MKLFDVISYNFNQRDTKKITIMNLEKNHKNSNINFARIYLDERNNLLNYLNNLVRDFSYTDRTFFFAISIFDTFFYELNAKNLRLSKDFKIDLILISSLLIAGITSHN